jgi:hypothetical protein
MLTVFALTVATGLYWRNLTGAVLGGHIAARLSATDKHPSDAEGRRHSTVPSPDRSPDELVAASPPGPNATAEVHTPVMAPPSEADPPVVGDTVRQEAVPPQTSAAATAEPPAPSKTDDGWASYRDARFGFALQYPFEVFLPNPEPSNEGKSFVSRDGRARLLISTAINAQDLTLAQHRRSLMQGTYKSATFRLYAAARHLVRAVRHARHGHVLSSCDVLLRWTGAPRVEACVPAVGTRRLRPHRGGGASPLSSWEQCCGLLAVTPLEPMRGLSCVVRGHVDDPRGRATVAPSRRGQQGRPKAADRGYLAGPPRGILWGNWRSRGDRRSSDDYR